MFRDLALPRKEVALASASRYRVYKNAKEFVVVDAANAKEALAGSGFDKAVRIEKESIHQVNVLTLSALQDRESDIAPAQPEASAPADSASPPAQAAPAQAAPQEQALSNDDVDKLLQG